MLLCIGCVMVKYGIRNNIVGYLFLTHITLNAYFTLTHL